MAAINSGMGAIFPMPLLYLASATVDVGPEMLDLEILDLEVLDPRQDPA
jgi:hypothetical protein